MMKCPTPYKLAGTPQEPGVYVPCGSCGACRANRRVEWSFRLKEELKQSTSAYFITLTYDEDSLPISSSGYPTLIKPDLQKFLKRFRKQQTKYTDAKIRYYAVGEYGTTTHRPHYHVISFNAHRATMDELSNIWKLGYITISPLNDARIHYTTKYHVNYEKEKRIRVDKETGEILSRTHNDKNQQREFALMSRKPGIGHTYVERAKKWHQENQNLYVLNNGYKQNLPRYYKQKIFEEEQLKIIQEKHTHENQQKHWEKLEALEKKGHKQPEKELKERRSHAAAGVKKKGGQSDIL